MTKFQVGDPVVFNSDEPVEVDFGKRYTIPAFALGVVKRVPEGKNTLYEVEFFGIGGFYIEEAALLAATER